VVSSGPPYLENAKPEQCRPVTVTAQSASREKVLKATPT
jgi:hypothetical protein